jgi:hypothetical protein
MNEGRCDERLKTRVEESMPHIHYWVARQRCPSQVYLQQIKKKAKAEGKTCHAKTMLSLEQPIKLL